MKLRGMHCVTGSVVAVVAALVDPASAIIVPTSGVSGRFIKVTNVNPYNRLLGIGEIEAFSFGMSPSAGSGVSANDIPGTFEAEGATSGFNAPHGANTATTNSALESGANVYTRGGVGTFHIIDLGATQNVGTIRLFNRIDCCQDRLTDVKVEVLADNAGVPGASQFSADYARVPNTPNFGQITVVGSRDILVAGAGVIGTETQGSAGGRFIRVKNNGGANRLLQLGEIEAFLTGVVPGGSYDNANDVALASKGASWESETGAFQHGLGGYMLDGAATGGAASWNRLGVDAELVIDLGQKRDLGTIRVWQRGDGCCQDRLMNFSVSLLDDNGSGMPGAVLNSQSFPGQPATNSFASFTLPAFNNTTFAIESTDTLVLDIDPLNSLADLLKVGPLGDGALTVKPGASLVINVLSPIPGNMTLDVLDFSSATGSFSSITVNGNATIDFSQLLVTGEISLIIPEPTTALLSLAGIGMLGLRAARRKRI